MQFAADGLVLAGGMARRMGQNKAALPYDASTNLAQHARDTLRNTVSGAIWVSRPLTWINPRETDIVDTVDHQGPLHGILQGLNRAEHDWLAVLAVDCPNVPPELFQTLYATRRPGDEVVVPYFGDITQPLAALWSKALRNPITAQLDAGQFKVGMLLNRVIVQYVRVADADWLVNLNTMTDWERWQRTTGGRL